MNRVSTKIHIVTDVKTKHYESLKATRKRKKLSDDEKKIDIESRKKHRFDNTYAKKLADGWKDTRIDNKPCPQCKRICVREILDGMDREMYTICHPTYTKHKTMWWAPTCLECIAKRSQEKRETFEGFTTKKAVELRHHLNGTMFYFRGIIDNARTLSGGRCSSCGIGVISAQKSGWRQETFNLCHPDLKKKPADEKHIVVSCMACNAFQNDYSWDKHVDNLIALSKPPPERNNDLSHIHRSWVRHCGRSANNKPLQRALLARDGKYCMASGVELNFTGGLWNTASVDRIDGSKGYTLENCRLVAAHINYVKNYSITEAELQRWITHIRSMDDETIWEICEPHMLDD